MVGVPTLFIILGLQFWGFAAILIIEAVTIRKCIKTTWGRSFGASFLANIVSFIIAVPLSRGFLLLIMTQFYNGYPVTGFAKIMQDAVWTTGSTSTAQGGYVISICLAFFVGLLFSIILEYLVLKLMFKKIDKKILEKTSLLMNGISYGLSILFIVGAYSLGML